MTTQTVHLHTFDHGASLSSATLRNLNDDTLAATADTTNEVTADGGLYAIVFDEVSVITAGTYRLRAIVGGQPLQRYVTLAGVDGEIVQAASEPAASTLTAMQAAIDLIETKAQADARQVAILAGLGGVTVAGYAAGQVPFRIGVELRHTASDDSETADVTVTEV